MTPFPLAAEVQGLHTVAVKVSLKYLVLLDSTRSRLGGHSLDGDGYCPMSGNRMVPIIIGRHVQTPVASKVPWYNRRMGVR